MSVANLTAGKRVRQTFARFNYQPGKSQLFFFTGVWGTSPNGITKEVGCFDDKNGLFFRNKDNVVSIVVRSFASGAAVDSVVEQSNWNGDKLDGTGPSGITLDVTKLAIWGIDFEWLGAGTIRYWYLIDGMAILIHSQHHANKSDVVYMSTPVLPIRYSIENDGTGPASTFDQICSTCISEGGENPIASLRYVSTNGTALVASPIGSVYAALGIRLNSATLSSVLEIVNVAIIGLTNDSYEWKIILNPTVAGTFTYNPFAGTVIDVARGVTANTVTGGSDITGGWISAQGDRATLSSLSQNAVQLGSFINGTQTTLVLCVRPLTNGLNIQAGMSFRENS